MKITRHGEAGQTNGIPFEVKAVFPNVTLEAQGDGKVNISNLRGKYTLVSVVPDINTRVCSLSTKKFNQEADQFAKINFYTVSTNTVAEQEQWCAAEGVEKMQLLADHDGQLGRKLGIYVEESHTDARSIWILDQKGRIVYRELIVEQSNEPNYQKALEFLKVHAK
ncbi:thiol peroxidase [Liquorilactobacillus sucicola DSM 21376 = JCM 15457]|nr:peroxiredoxin [Liquorilactobacillus sucicola]GAJ26707.1 thiol peroxidase [Liquorilactobacillus sucicola DSM 21376 = JCM 15457]